MRPRKTAFNDPRRCENCTRFIQHYVKNSNSPGGFMECGAGHCIFGRARNTKGYFTCENFAPKETADETKEP